jgi:hypothetical protein
VENSHFFLFSLSLLTHLVDAGMAARPARSLSTLSLMSLIGSSPGLGRSMSSPTPESQPRGRSVSPGGLFRTFSWSRRSPSPFRKKRASFEAPALAWRRVEGAVTVPPGRCQFGSAVEGNHSYIFGGVGGVLG